MLKVNKEGTGSATTYPNSCNHFKPLILGLPPQAIISLSNESDSLFTASVNSLFSIVILLTGLLSDNLIPNFFISDCKQSIIV